METWEGIHQTREWGRWPDLELVRAVKRDLLGLGSGRALRVLEVGVGGAANLRFCVEEGMSIAGIDLSPTAIACAERRLKSWSGLGRASFVSSSSGDALVVGDARSLPWPEESFDLILDCFCLCYLDSRGASAAYAEAYRCARPGAALLIRAFDVECTAGESAGYGKTFFDAGPLAGTPAVRLSSLDQLVGMTPGWTLKTARHITVSDTLSGVQVAEHSVLMEKANPESRW